MRLGNLFISLIGFTFAMAAFAALEPCGRVVFEFDSRAVDIAEILNQFHDIETTAISPDRKRFAIAHFDRVTVWELESRKELNQFSGATGSITHLVFSPDSKRLAFADGRKLTLVDLNSSKVVGLHNYRTGVFSVEALAFSNKGKLAAATGNVAGKAHWLFWPDASTSNQLDRPTIFNPPTDVGFGTVLGFSPDETVLGTATTGRHALLWDLKSGSPLVNAKIFKGSAINYQPPTAIALADNGAFFAVGTGEGDLVVASKSDNPASPKIIRKGNLSFERIDRIAMRTDGAFLAVHTSGGALRVFESDASSRRSPRFSLRYQTDGELDVTWRFDVRGN